MDTIQGTGRAAGFRFALVVSKYNDFVTDRLQAGALAALAAGGVTPADVTVVRVPGAFEIPLAARRRTSTSSPLPSRTASRQPRPRPGFRWRSAC
jgi:6,7-dimethyl-8-ribityllumazine synthase